MTTTKRFNDPVKNRIKRWVVFIEDKENTREVPIAPW